jgi:hypothetical protein
VSWQRGDRVWYEPSESIRFAGIVLGDGSCAGSVRMLLTGHYFRWRWVNSARCGWVNSARCGGPTPPPFKNDVAPAIGAERLCVRECYLSMDAEFSKREETDG